MDKNKIDEHFQHIDKKRASSPVETIVIGTVINWEEIGEEDYKAEYKGFNLRLEAMGRNLWWFQVYENGEALWHEKNLVFTKEEAERKILAQIKTLRAL